MPRLFEVYRRVDDDVCDLFRAAVGAFAHHLNVYQLLSMVHQGCPWLPRVDATSNRRRSIYTLVTLVIGTP